MVIEGALIIGAINAFTALVPIIYPKVKELLEQGEDPKAFDWVDWVKFYGRSPAELQAEVNAEAEGKTTDTSAS